MHSADEKPVDGRLVIVYARDKYDKTSVSTYGGSWQRKLTWTGYKWCFVGTHGFVIENVLGWNYFPSMEMTI